MMYQTVLIDSLQQQNYLLKRATLHNTNYSDFTRQQQPAQQLLCLPLETPQPQATTPTNQPAAMMDDPVYLYDEQVFDRMLASEKRQNIPSYFGELDNSNNCPTIKNNKYQQQLDFNQTDRRALATWMNDVCLAEECQPDVFPLSILIVDRFLYFVKQTKRKQLQLLGSVALLLASKLRQTIQIPAKHLIYYTQDLITMQELKTWELFVLTTLKWDLNFITPVDYLDILLKRLTINDEHIISDIEEQTQRLIIQCCFDFKHSIYPSSIIAWACFLQALEFWNLEPDKTINFYPKILNKVSIGFNSH